VNDISQVTSFIGGALLFRKSGIISLLEITLNHDYATFGASGGVFSLFPGEVY
jgi:hypothetical protein